MSARDLTKTKLTVLGSSLSMANCTLLDLLANSSFISSLKKTLRVSLQSGLEEGSILYMRVTPERASTAPCSGEMEITSGLLTPATSNLTLISGLTCCDCTSEPKRSMLPAARVTVYSPGTPSVPGIGMTRRFSSTEQLPVIGISPSGPLTVTLKASVIRILGKMGKVITTSPLSSGTDFEGSGSTSYLSGGMRSQLRVMVSLVYSTPASETTLRAPSGIVRV